MKLYSLEIVEDENSSSRVMACSNELEKLQSVVFTPNRSFTVVNDPNDKTLKMETTRGVYPLYLFREMPYIV